MDSESAEKREQLALGMKLALPNDLDDSIGKVARHGSYLEDVVRTSVAILGGLRDDAYVLIAQQNFEWLYGMAVAFRKNPVYNTRRCNDQALPDVEKALKEARDVWRRRSEVVHVTWNVCPALMGGSCDIAASNDGDVGEDEFHVAWSIRHKAERGVAHRDLEELEQLVVDLEEARAQLIAALASFDPAAFR